MTRGSRLLFAGSIHYLAGSAIFTVQANDAGDGWGTVASLAFLLSSFFFIASTWSARS